MKLRQCINPTCTEQILQPLYNHTVYDRIMCPVFYFIFWMVVESTFFNTKIFVVCFS